MNTIQKAMDIFGGVESDWSIWANGGGIVHKQAQIEKSVYVEGIVFSGTISGDAQISGDAWIYGDAQIYGNARISGNARIEKTPLFIQGSRHSLNSPSPGLLRIGCKIQKLFEWLKNFKEVGKANGYTIEEIEEYGEYIKLFQKQERK